MLFLRDKKLYLIKFLPFHYNPHKNTLILTVFNIFPLGKRHLRVKYCDILLNKT